MKEQIVSTLRSRIGVLVITVLVIAGLVGGGVVLAQDGSNGDDDLLAVAEISATRTDTYEGAEGNTQDDDESYYRYDDDIDDGYDELQVIEQFEHFAPASGDEVANGISPGLARAVADGAVTQSEADELLEWLRDAPSVIFTVWQRFDALTVDEQVGLFPSYAVADIDSLTAESYEASVWAGLIQAGVLTAEEMLAVTEWLANVPSLVSDQLGGTLGDLSFATSDGGSFIEAPPGLEVYFFPASGSEIANALAPGLSRAVAAGDISQSAADELLEWLRSSPDAVFALPERFGELTLNELDSIFFDPLEQPVVAFNDPDTGAPVEEPGISPEEHVSSILDGLVQAEILTSEEASAILEWLKRVPEVVDEELLGGFTYGISSGVGITPPLGLVEPYHGDDYGDTSGGFEIPDGAGDREE